MKTIRLNLLALLLCFLIPAMSGCTEADSTLDEDTTENNDKDDDDDDDDDDKDVTTGYASVTTLASTGSTVDINPETFTPNYAKPEAPFSVYIGEAFSSVSYTAASVDGLQTLIDNARAAAGDMDIVTVYLKSQITVSTTPLVLPHHTVLYFQTANARIIASDTATANELIKIEDAECVGIKRVPGTTSDILLDGKGVVNCGINIINSGKITIEEAKIVNCKQYGIDASGTGADITLCDVIAVVASTITDCTSGGIRIQESANPILSDNTIKSCGVGIDVSALAAIMQYNTLSDNTTGIYYDAVDATIDPAALISRNTLKDNSSTGIELTDNCGRVMIYDNTVEGSSVGITADGIYNRILANDLSGNTTAYSNGETRAWNFVLQNEDVASTDNVGNRFFNPPTLSNPHTGEVRSNMGRADLTITQSGDEPMNMVDVQAQIDTFVAENSSSHVVVWLNGEFVAKDTSLALKLSSNISIVLDGRIYAAPEDGKTRQESAMYSNYAGSADDPVGYSGKSSEDGNTIMVSINVPSTSTYVSFSGGEIDCQSLACWGFFTPSTTTNEGVIVLDGVTVNSAVYNNIAPLNHTSGSGPVFIHNCSFDGTYVGDEDFDNTNRGVWIHMSQYIYCMNCTSSNHLADAVDIDASGHNSMVAYSNTTDECRFGVFIEEGASNNVIVGNLFRRVSATSGNGCGLYASNPSTQGYCSNNIIAFNTANNPTSFQLRYSQYAISFNNRMPSNCQYGVYLNSLYNYSGQINTSMDMDLRSTALNTFTDNEFFTLP